MKIKRVLIFSTMFVRTFLILRRTKRDRQKMYIGLHVKYRIFMSDFNETGIFCKDFRKILIFQENVFSGSLVVPCGRMHGRTDT
jgi:hypothetical protein